MKRGLALLGMLLALAGGALAADAPPRTARAIFAGGCFWCVESDFEKLPGVISAVSGYTGGHTKNVKYEDTHDGRSGHTEAVELAFDPAKVNYAQLVDYFFRHHDLLDGGGQFCDRGSQYRPAIFYLDDEQKKIAETARDTLARRFGQPIRTEITPAGTFWVAEDEHQDYYKTHALRYRYYRHGCGRDARVDAIWGSPPVSR